MQREQSRSTNINKMIKTQSQRFAVQKVETVQEENEEAQISIKEPIEQPQKKSNGSASEPVKKSQFSNDKAKIADVFELPITVVNNVLY